MFGHRLPTWGTPDDWALSRCSACQLLDTECDLHPAGSVPAVRALFNSYVRDHPVRREPAGAATEAVRRPVTATLATEHIHCGSSIEGLAVRTRPGLSDPSQLVTLTRRRRIGVGTSRRHTPISIVLHLPPLVSRLIDALGKSSPECLVRRLRLSKNRKSEEVPGRRQQVAYASVERPFPERGT